MILRQIDIVVSVRQRMGSVDEPLCSWARDQPELTAWSAQPRDAGRRQTSVAIVPELHPCHWNPFAVSAVVRFARTKALPPIVDQASRSLTAIDVCAIPSAPCGST